MQHVAAYTRISKDRDGLADGVATQERRARRYAAEHWPELPLVVYCDNDLTAADPGTTRPAYERMLGAIRRGEVAQVVCAEQSRLTRQPAEWEDLVVTLTRAGIKRVHCYRQGVVEVGGSRLIGRILAAVDAEEVERLRTRINDKLDAIAAEGRPAGGSSYGYRRATGPDGKKTLAPLPERAEVIRWAAERVLAGWPLSHITDKLVADGAPTARGGTWNPTTVRAMLQCPTIAGLRVHRGKVVGPGNWPAIVELDLWRQVQAALSGPYRASNFGRPAMRPRRPRRRTWPRRRRWLLTGGLTRCGRCDAPLIAQARRARDGTKTPALTCHPSLGGCSGLSILMEPVEAWVVDQLLTELDNPRFRAAVAADEDGDRRRSLLDRYGAVEERRAELARRWAVGELSAGEWDAARSVLDAEAADLTDELDALPAPSAALDPDELRADWPHLTLDEKRKVLTTYIDRVIVSPAKRGTRRFDHGRVVIKWR